MKLLLVVVAIFISSLKAESSRLLVENDVDDIFEDSINTEGGKNGWHNPESVKAALLNPVPPVAIFHGLMESCSNPDNHYQDWINHMKPLANGTYLACLESGADFKGTILTSLEEQGKHACNLIKSDPHYAGGLSIIGGSNGGAIVRYIVQKCDLPMPIYNVVSIGGPQAGAFKLPLDRFFKKHVPDLISSALNWFVDRIVYIPLIQWVIGPSSYFRVANEENYWDNRTLMAELNNENGDHHPEYAEKMKALNHFVMIKWLKDDVIFPSESEWFGIYDKDGKTVIKMEDRDFYKNDYIGLRYLQENGKLVRSTVDGVHGYITYDILEKQVVPYLLSRE